MRSKRDFLPWGIVLAVACFAIGRETQAGGLAGAITEMLRSFGGPVKCAGATTGQSAVKQADGSWAPAWPNGGAPGGAAGGDLSGTYPNPSVASVGTLSAAQVAAYTPTANQKGALGGADTGGSPTGANPFVTNTDTRLPTGSPAPGQYQAWNGVAYVPSSGVNADACLVHGSSNQTITGDGIFHSVTFDVTDVDTNTMHSNSVNNSRINIKQTGIYILDAQTTWSIAVSQARLYGVGFLLNGATALRTRTQEYNTSDPTFGNFYRYAMLVTALTAGDYVEMQALCYNVDTALVKGSLTLGTNFRVQQLASGGAGAPANTFPIGAPNGSFAAPSYAWGAETDLGRWRPAAGWQWDTKKLGVGSGNNGVAPTGIGFPGLVLADDVNGEFSVVATNVNGLDAAAPRVSMNTGRSSIATPSAVGAGDTLAKFTGRGYIGPLSKYVDAAAFTVSTDDSSADNSYISGHAAIGTWEKSGVFNYNWEMFNDGYVRQNRGGGAKVTAFSDQGVTLTNANSRCIRMYNLTNSRGINLPSIATIPNEGDVWRIFFSEVTTPGSVVTISPAGATSDAIYGGGITLTEGQSATLLASTKGGHGEWYRVGSNN